jgi:hypothetical protein
MGCWRILWSDRVWISIGYFFGSRPILGRDPENILGHDPDQVEVPNTNHTLK